MNLLAALCVFGLLATTAHAGVDLPTPTETSAPTSTATPGAATPSETVEPTRTATPSVTPTATITPTLRPEQVADINCDGAHTAADFVAAVIVSNDPARFFACAGADPYRNQALTDADFLPLLHALFATFDVPWTPTPTASPTLTATPTITPTPSLTPRVTPSLTPSLTPSRTRTPTASATPTRTASPTPTFSPTFTDTPTSTPSATPTRTATTTRTRTPVATPTPAATFTPTGIVYRLSGEWLATWRGQICYLNGLPFAALVPTRYRVTAIDGLLDISIVDGPRIGAGLQPDANGTVAFTYRMFDNRICLPAGTREEFVYAYTFTFHLNGTGSATSHWTYGFNTNCAVCTVDDSAALVRVGLP